MWADLRRHKTTLRDLWLDYFQETIGWMREGGMDDVSPIASLADFSALIRVKLAMVFLFGKQPADVPDHKTRLVEPLPPQIEYVKITHGEDEPDFALDALEYLIAQKSGKFRQLRYVEVEYCAEGVNDRIARFQKLKQLAENEEDLVFVARSPHGDIDRDEYEQCVERKWGFDEDIEWRACNSGYNERPVYRLHDLGG